MTWQASRLPWQRCIDQAFVCLLQRPDQDPCLAPSPFPLRLIDMRLQNQHKKFMHGTVIRFSHSTIFSILIPLDKIFFVFFSSGSLERTISISVPFRRQQKAIASLYNFCFLYIADPILLFLLFESCSLISGLNCTPTSCTSNILGGPRHLYLFPFFLRFLPVSSPPSSALPTFLFLFSAAYKCAAHILINCAVIIVEGGLRACDDVCKDPARRRAMSFNVMHIILFARLRPGDRSIFQKSVHEYCI